MTPTELFQEIQKRDPDLASEITKVVEREGLSPELATYLEEYVREYDHLEGVYKEEQDKIYAAYQQGVQALSKEIRLQFKRDEANEKPDSQSDAEALLSSM